MTADATDPDDPAARDAPGPAHAAGHRTHPGRRPRGAITAATVLLATMAATAVAGFPAGYIWARLAPRALAQVVSRGAANVVNPETTAFIAADAWYILIAAIGGLLTGAAGYLLVVRRRGPAAAAGSILGGLAAAAVMLWIGGSDGHAAFTHQLFTSPAGTYLHASLALGAKSGMLFWPMAGALAIVVPEAVNYFRGSRASSRPVRNVDEPAGQQARSVD